MRLVHQLFIGIVFSILACDSEDAQPEAQPPSNLNVTTEVSSDSSGKVRITATATKSNFYEFEFGEDESAPATRDDDGTIDYTYSASGTYNITVRAHTTQEVFIETTSQVSVTVSDSEGTIPNVGYTTPDSYAGYNLTWRDEFDGTSLNEAYWTYEIGTGSNGWGNNELQYYRKENTSVTDGYLIIEAKEENFSGSNYTSSRIITEGKQEFQYGRVDIRALLPKDQGIWPALWMLGSNFRSVGWPNCGEIDIMELVGGPGKDNTVHGTVHWDNAGSYANYGDSYTLSTGIFNDEFHVFSIIWDATSIKWYVDDNLYNTIDITPAELNEFTREFFFIFNVAVGGNWPGSPDASTSFPQRMVVDYIRVFQLQ